MIYSLERVRRIPKVLLDDTMESNSVEYIFLNFNEQYKDSAVIIQSILLYSQRIKKFVDY
ncbi:hypothetical protein B0O79_1437 [Flavobacteriaceae bacterium MAR_2009_75]|nr:hypothetical protein B0O79_1437 [Flavobacteriaceae bacterium MAR_2009_75]